MTSVCPNPVTLAQPPTPDAADHPDGFVAGNYFDKYRSTSRIHRHLMDGFIRAARAFMQAAQPRRVLEVGCGSGDLADRLLDPAVWPAARVPEYCGTDVSPEQIALARARCPGRAFQTCSVYRLPYPDASVDLVIACEVLEHLADPARALAEVARVTRGRVLISVPREPLWRALNLCRGAYWRHFGNTPGHVQHFSVRSLRQLVGRRFVIEAERRPVPWIMMLARRPDSSAGFLLEV